MPYVPRTGTRRKGGNIVLGMWPEPGRLAPVIFWGEVMIDIDT